MTVSLILAAGSSSRMGEPKMLLMYKGKTLLQHVIDEAKFINDNLLIVVTGRYHDLLVPLLQQQSIEPIKNEQWKNGMGSSVSAGVCYILKNFPSAENVLILTCDQPFVSTALLQQLINTKVISGKGIAACAYGDTVGIPVLFDKKYFNLLLSLKDNKGAKKIVSDSMKDVVSIDFPAGIIDIDEPKDYEKLIQRQ